MRLFLDYETRSELDLPEVGLDRYATDKSTQVILCAYKFKNSGINLWQPHLNDIPRDLQDALYDPSVEVNAWNVAFEKAITKWILSIDIETRRCRDTMIKARYMSLPGRLEECGKALKLPTNLLKFEGDELKNKFCIPVKKGGLETLFGVSEAVFKDWESDPEDWKKFCGYCIQDVIAEEAIDVKLEDFPIPEYEWEIFELDQEINERGVYVNPPLVDGAAYIAETEKSLLLKRLDDITELENSNSRDQVLEWVSKHGFTFHSLGKNFVTRALDGECELTPEAREVLTIRQQSSKTSASKLVGIKNQLSSDYRLRHQYSYYGASRTGRWSSGSGE